MRRAGSGVVTVDRIGIGTCGYCGAFIEGEPGGPVRCWKCGSVTGIPLTSYSEAPPPAPAVAKQGLPAPAQEVRSLKRPVREGPRRSLRTVVKALIVVLLLVGTAAAIVAYVPPVKTFVLGPNAAQVEARLNAGDADGHEGAYRLSGAYRSYGPGRSFEDISVAFQAEPRDRQVQWEIGEAVRVEKGDLYIIMDTNASQQFRNYVKHYDPFFLYGGMFQVLERDGRTYSGTWGVAANVSFTLKLDRVGRFDTIEFEDERGRTVAELQYTYDLVRFRLFPASVTRHHADLDHLAASKQTPNRMVRVPIVNMSDAVKPAELDVRFLDASGKTIRNLTFAETALSVPFTFRWDDLNNDTFVDRGDSYQFKFSSATKSVRIWDTWAKEYVDTPRLGLAPALGPLAALAILGALVRVRRRA